MKAAIKDLTFNREGKQIVSFELDKSEDFRPLYDKYNGKILALDIKEYKQKRSLNANNYAWKLITDIANELRTSKDEVYLLMLKRYGQSAKIDLRNDIDASLHFDYYQVLETKGDFTTYFVCVGSSRYNTYEMTVFIDGIVSEAKILGIPTETPDEIARMTSLWEGR